MIDETDTIGLTLTRVIPASPEEVFDAYTDAEKQMIWYTLLSEHPGVVEIDVDLRVGGVQHAKWGPSADQLFWEDQTFLEIDRPRRLVTSSTGGTPEGDTMTTRVEVTFDEDAGGTLMTVVQTGFPTVEMRDFFASMAWIGAFDRIAAYFEQRG
jgi:uncharacterized protein YndB with AHSA1/START domain